MEKTKNKIEKEIAGKKEEKFFGDFELMDKDFSDDFDALDTDYDPYFEEQLNKQFQGGEVLPEKAKAEVAEKVKEIKAIKAEALRKIEGLEDGADGGWYEHVETGEKYYVKTFDANDHAKIYYFANKIYSELGIPVANMELVDFGDKIGVAEKEIEGKMNVTDSESITEAAEYKEGYVADIFVGNMTSVYGYTDGFVGGSNGQLYRVGFEDAMWDGWYASVYTDEYPSEIYENLDNFEERTGLTDEDIKKQIEHFKEVISESFVKNLYQEIGANGEWAERLLARLHNLDGQLDNINMRIKENEAELERQRKEEEIRKTRMEKAREITDMELQPVSNNETIAAIMGKFEALSPEQATPFAPKASFVADKSHIESQQIDVINDLKSGTYKIRFKLTAEDAKRISGSMAQLKEDKLGVDSEISYGGSHIFSAAEFVYKFNGEMIKILISTSESRSSLGLIQIELLSKVSETEVSAADLEQILQAVSHDLLGLEAITEKPDAESEEKYKQARYFWHHKLDPESDEAKKQYEKAKKGLIRETVFPGIEYSTIVESGRGAEYENKYGPLVIFHNIHSFGNLPSIIKAGGLLCTHERYSRGGIISGMSSSADLKRGGGDSVFTRIATHQGLEHSKNLTNCPVNVAFVFDNSLLDRTDWYAYNDDHYGDTSEDIFGQRKSPEAFLELLNTSSYFPSGNEQMFRTGIPMEKVKCIWAASIHRKKEVVDCLTKAGIAEINGITLDDFIVVGETFGDYFEAIKDYEGETKFAKAVRKTKGMVKKTQYKAKKIITKVLDQGAPW